MMMNVLAKRINEAFSSKPIESKFKALAESYCSPENCNLLKVPRVNPRKRDVGLQNLSKSFRSLCSSSTPLSRFLFGDEWSKSVKDITRANKIMAKVMPKKGKTSSDDRQDKRPFLRDRKITSDPWILQCVEGYHL